MFDKVKDFVKTHKKGIAIGSVATAGLAGLLILLNRGDCADNDTHEIPSNENTTEESSDEN